MAWFHKRTWQEEAQDRLSHQLDILRREVQSLGRSTARYSQHVGHDASELGDQLWHQGEAVARIVGRSAKKAGKAVKEDPVPAVVAVVGFALFLNLVLGRR